MPIEPFDLLFREIQLHFAFINPFTHTRAAALIASGAIAVAPLISRTIPLSEAAEAIANPPHPGEVKVLVIAPDGRLTDPVDSARDPAQSYPWNRLYSQMN